MTEKDLQKIKLKHLKNNIELYNNNLELVTMYDEYIKKIVELFDFVMARKDDLFYTIVFNILMEMGFFSYNHTFNDNLDDFNELSIKPGINIVAGYGVCRNIACFYEDITKYFYNYPLKICCFDKKGELNNDTKLYGNHVINLTKYHDIIYGFDIMNHCLFTVTSKSKLTGFNLNYSLIYKMYGDILIKLVTDLENKNDYVEKLKTKKMLLEIAARSPIITNNDYEKLINEANEFLINRKKIFQSFLEENAKLTQEINEKMLVLK